MSTTTARHDIAAKFNETAQAAMTKRGERGSSAAVGRILGLPRSQWHAYCQGANSPSIKTVQGWCEKWDMAGYPTISVLVDADEVLIIEADPD